MYLYTVTPGSIADKIGVNNIKDSLALMSITDSHKLHDKPSKVDTDQGTEWNKVVRLTVEEANRLPDGSYTIDPEQVTEITFITPRKGDIRDYLWSLGYRPAPLTPEEIRAEEENTNKSKYDKYSLEGKPNVWLGNVYLEIETVLHAHPWISHKKTMDHVKEFIQDGMSKTATDIQVVKTDKGTVIFKGDGPNSVS